MLKNSREENSAGEEKDQKRARDGSGGVGITARVYSPCGKGKRNTAKISSSYTIHYVYLKTETEKKKFEITLIRERKRGRIRRPQARYVHSKRADTKERGSIKGKIYSSSGWREEDSEERSSNKHVLPTKSLFAFKGIQNNRRRQRVDKERDRPSSLEG